MNELGLQLSVTALAQHVQGGLRFQAQHTYSHNTHRAQIHTLSTLSTHSVPTYTQHTHTPGTNIKISHLQMKSILLMLHHETTWAGNCFEEILITLVFLLFPICMCMCVVCTHGGPFSTPPLGCSSSSNRSPCSRKFLKPFYLA